MKSQRESVLVVDDDSEVLTALDAELSEYFDVTALLSAEQALATLQGRAFSAIISDVRMPGIDGLTLIRECAVRYPDMVRLLLTAFDDEEVQETALGEFGAYKLIKPWGDDLIVTLQNALKQRKSNIELQKSIDLGSAAVELDLRLHLNLSPKQVIDGAVTELLRVPEVTNVSLIQFNDAGQTITQEAFGNANSEDSPKLTRKRFSSPEQDGKFFKYTVTVGTWPTPCAACVCRLTKVNDTSIRYMDYIARQAYRTLLIVSNRQPPDDSGRISLSLAENEEQQDVTGRPSKMTQWINTELAMPTTVIVSATESLRAEAQRLSQHHQTTTELEEIASDLDAVYASLTTFAERFK